MTVRPRIGRVALTFLALVALLGGAFPAAVVAADPDPSAGFDATWTVTGADGEPRTDGKVAVGDDLAVTFAAVDGTPVTQCKMRIASYGGFIMDTPGRLADGVCSLSLRIPDFPNATERAEVDPDDSDLDFCLWVMTIQFEDGELRMLDPQDKLEPGGRECATFWMTGDLDMLDFPVQPGGTPRPFQSDPLIVSWNPADWGADGQDDLRFGETWSWEAPPGIDKCRVYLNGEWATVIQPQAPPGCVGWSVRVPGVLPANLPWGGDDYPWGYSVVIDYEVDEPGPNSQTISWARTPLAPSDTVFESSLPAIFPVDLAPARFVTAGDRWQPVYQVQGISPDVCTMTVITVPPGWPDVEMIEDHYEAAIDEDGRCAFDVDPMGADVFHQYFVIAGTLLDTGSAPTFGGDIQTIPVPEPPVIDEPVEEEDGDTEIGVDPGDGQGLAVVLEVTEDPLTIETTRDTQADGPVVCTDQAISTDLNAGGQIPHLDASCGLAPGRYVATATMVDASGKEVSAERPFVVESAPPHVSAHTPFSGATGVARDIRPTVTFDVPVTGVSASSVRIREVTTGTYRSATVAYDAGTHKATLTPSSLLTPGRTYRVSLSSAIKNADDASLDPTGWNFTVTKDKTPPTIVARTPGKDATGVRRTANVAVRFSTGVKGVNGSSFQLRDVATGLYVPATVTYDSARYRAVLNPTGTLAANHRYLVIVRSAIKDKAGNPFKTTTWGFKTRS